MDSSTKLITGLEKEGWDEIQRVTTDSGGGAWYMRQDGRPRERARENERERERERGVQ